MINFEMQQRNVVDLVLKIVCNRRVFKQIVELSQFCNLGLIFGLIFEIYTLKSFHREPVLC